MSQVAYHLKLSKSQLQGATKVLLPGDPDRVPFIGQFLTRFTPLAQCREFHSGLGYWGEEPILVCSTGIGGASSAITIEELALLGLKTYIRIGTTGAIQAPIEAGDILIPTAAVRQDGASRHIAPLSYPAVANFELVRNLMDSARKAGIRAHQGVILSSDTFYQGQGRQDGYLKGLVPYDLENRLEYWQKMGIMAYEMEAATVLTQTSVYGLKGAVVLAVILNRAQGELPDDQQGFQKTIEKAIKVALFALEQSS